jgi:mitogen-activated protein kinase organizer 1
VRLFNPALGKEIKKYAGHAQEVLHVDMQVSLSYSLGCRLIISAHDNAKFASCGGDKTVFVWDVASGQIIRRLQGHFGKVFSVAFNQDAQILASGGFDAKVMLWDMR